MSLPMSSEELSVNVSQTHVHYAMRGKNHEAINRSLQRNQAGLLKLIKDSDGAQDPKEDAAAD